MKVEGRFIHMYANISLLFLIFFLNYQPQMAIFPHTDLNNPDAGIKLSFTSHLLLLNINSCY